MLDLANLLIIGSIIGPIWFERFKVVFASVMFLAGIGAWIFLYLSRMEAKTRPTFTKFSLSVMVYFLLAVGLFFAGCTRPAWLVGIGIGGRYSEAREEITKRRGGNIDKAIISLEAVVREDPTYRDSLTLLGRAYYMKGRYQDAWQIIQRAVAVNPEDEIAWMVLGMAQLRLGEDEKGLKAVQGGLTLFNKASTEGYRGYIYWDRAGNVKTVVRRTIAVARKGLEEKDNLIRAVESLVAAIDEEEFNSRLERTLEKYKDLGS